MGRLWRWAPARLICFSTRALSSSVEKISVYANLFADLGTTERVLLVMAIAAIAHLSVRVIRHLGQRLLSAEAMLRWTKVRTLAGLFTSITVFVLYFGVFGLVLSEFGVSLTAYLASASIILDSAVEHRISAVPQAPGQGATCR